MTCREKLAIEHPEMVVFDSPGGCRGCPMDYDYMEHSEGLCIIYNTHWNSEICTKCWDQEVEEEVEQLRLEEIKEEKTEHLDLGMVLDIDQQPVKDFDLAEHMDKLGNYIVQGFTDSIVDTIENQKTILDSGERRQFETGAVRDIQEGKGRCDLMPLDIVGGVLEDVIIYSISEFVKTGDIIYLKDAIGYFSNGNYGSPYTMLLEVSKHFEEGAKKYGENNWQKGIPTHCYIDSAVRHYLKWLRGDQDEPHDRAFVWNLLCCMWTVVNKPELDDYRRKTEEE